MIYEAITDILKIIPEANLKALQLYRKITSSITILPVPLHRQRFNKRGFNQSAIMGTFFANYLGTGYDDSVVRRIKDTTPQVNFKTNKERYLNVSGAFELFSQKRPNIIGKNFIIVDDVWTTGSTIKEIGRILKRGGAGRVFALTLAR